MNTDEKRQRREFRAQNAWQIFLAHLSNPSTIVGNPKVVENIMRDSFSLADRWLEIVAKEYEGGENNDQS